MNTNVITIKSKGWTVVAACKFWGMETKTFYSRLKNPKFDNQMKCLCDGLKEFDI